MNLPTPEVTSSPPVVFGPLAETDPLAREEIFGPVLAVLEFDTEEEAIAIANGADYGLVAGIWTENGGRQQTPCDRDQDRTGIYQLLRRRRRGRATLCGIGKSGHGPEKGLAALREFCVTKTIVNYYE